jgi:hypothetical protein
MVDLNSSFFDEIDEDAEALADAEGLVSVRK